MRAAADQRDRRGGVMRSAIRAAAPVFRFEALRADRGDRGGLQGFDIIHRWQDAGRRLANRLLPVPGGPENNRLCPPAAAISSARRARDCPRTSARSRVSVLTSGAAKRSAVVNWRTRIQMLCDFDQMPRRECLMAIDQGGFGEV